MLIISFNSALDAESEHLVQEALERVARNRTVITIAHRLSTIRHSGLLAAYNATSPLNCIYFTRLDDAFSFFQFLDKIAVLNDGRFDEVGAYHELMTIQDGMFRRLVEKQTIEQ